MAKKKVGENSKAVEARERKEAAASAAKVKAEAAAQDAYWKSQGEGAKTKAQQKKDEQERQKQEAALKKAEAKKLAEQEDAELGSKKPKSQGTKVTRYQLDLQKEADKKQQEIKSREQEQHKRREVSEEEYSRMVDVENLNRQQNEGDIVASGVAAAVEQISMSSKQEEDLHPERRMKAAWKAFYERELPIVKEEKPNMRLPQYKELLWKKWQKSPENPMLAKQ